MANGVLSRFGIVSPTPAVLKDRGSRCLVPRERISGRKGRSGPLTSHAAPSGEPDPVIVASFILHDIR